MKKILYFFLGVTLFLPTALASAQAIEFSDVSNNYIYFDEVQYLKNNNIVNGYNDGRFGVEDQIKRNEFIKILVNSKFPSAITNTCKDRNPGIIYTDVPSDNEFAPFICIAKEFGIISGYADGTFKPYNYISYPEAAKILVRTFYNYDINANSPLSSYTTKLEKLNLVPPTTSEAIELAGNTNVDLKRGEMASLIYGSKVERPNEGNKTFFGEPSIELISFEDAIKSANSATNENSITEIELKHNGALLMYEVESDNTTIQIDAKTGTLINKFVESEELIDYLITGIISPEDVLDTAKKITNIKTVDKYDIKLEKEDDGRYTYSIEMEGEGKEVELEIDGKNKELLELIWGELDGTKVLNILTPEQAIEYASKIKLSILPDMAEAKFDAELKKENNNYFYSIDIELSDETEIEIIINAKNGKTIGLELDDNEDEDEDDEEEDDGDDD